MREFMDAAAARITGWVGTMYCALVFTALTLVSLPATLATGDPVLIVQWIAQTFLQLVLLSVIMVGQNLQQAVTMKLITETHDVVTAELAELHALVEAVHATVKEEAGP